MQPRVDSYNLSVDNNGKAWQAICTICTGRTAMASLQLSPAGGAVNIRLVGAAGADLF